MFLLMSIYLIHQYQIQFLILLILLSLLFMNIQRIMNKIIFILMMFILFLLVFVLLAKIIGIGFAGNLDAPMYFFSWKEIWDYKYVFCISSAFCSLFISLLYFDVKQKKE